MLAAALAFSVAATSVGGGPGAPPARTLVLAPAQMFRLAEVAEGRADLRLAFAIYAALEDSPDPDIRAEARFRHAKRLLGESRNSDAAVLLRQILDEKPKAVPVRLALAQLLDRMGDKDAAWREIRAAQAIGLPPAVARLVDRYSEALRAARPQGASLEIALAPDSNINRATRSDTLGTVLGDFEIDKDGKARSGTGLSVHGQAYRRLALGDGDTSLLVRLSGLADLYKRTEFNDIAVDLAAGPELQWGETRVHLEAGATQRFFGQKPYLRSARLGATVARPLGRRTLLRLSGSAALVDNQRNDLQDGKSYSAGLDLERALSATTGVVFNLSGDREQLKDPGYATTGWRGGLSLWRDLGRVTLTAGAQFGRLHADERLVLFPDTRRDRYSSFSLGATFRQMQWRGFAPVARFTVERNQSSIAFYDYRRTRTEIGVVRAF